MALYIICPCSQPFGKSNWNQNPSKKCDRSCCKLKKYIKSIYLYNSDCDWAMYSHSMHFVGFYEAN